MRSNRFLIISYPYSVNGSVEFRHLQLVVQDIAELYSVIKEIQSQPTPVAVSILTSKGDLLTNDGTQDVRFPVGTDGRVLMADSSSPEGLLWQDPSLLIPAAVWGSITGVLSNQTDLQTALNAKQNTSEKNQLNGYAGLDGSGKISGAQQVYGSTANTACEGNDSRLSDARTPTAHAASHVNGTDDIQLANASQKGLLSSTDWSTFNGKQNALGYTPLNPANNLSDVSNAVTAKDNLNVIDKYSTADLVTASTSLSTITGLSVTLAANTTYVFEASGSVSNSANNGCRLGVNFPSGTCTLELTAASTAITNQTSESADYTTTGGVEIVRTFASVATTRLWWKISGIIEVGVTGGTFAIMGKTVNVANTATFHQRSRLSIRILN